MAQVKAFAERNPQSGVVCDLIRDLRGESKYGNRVQWHDGLRFDSDAEYERWRQLECLQFAGYITNLAHHRRWVIQAPFVDSDGKKHRAITYECDASYTDWECPGYVTAEDTKGFWTTDFRMKLKLMASKYPGVKMRIVQV